MKPVRIIKLVAAIALLITFFLPISRCTVEKKVLRPPSEAMEGKEKNVIQKSETSQANTDTQRIVRYNIPYKMFAPDEFVSWLMLLAFIWPLPILAYTQYEKKRKIITCLLSIEPITCLGSGYMIGCIAFWGDIVIGGYIALASVSIYFIASCCELFVLIKNYIRNKRGEQSRTV